LKTVGVWALAALKANNIASTTKRRVKPRFFCTFDLFHINFEQNVVRFGKPDDRKRLLSEFHHKFSTVILQGVTQWNKSFGEIPQFASIE
jgi:hypothetical protein